MSQYSGREAYVLGEASDADAIAQHPGIYVAPSSSPSYPVLLALVLEGRAKKLGDTQMEDGGAAVAVEVTGKGYRANVGGSITIGADFFAGAKDDYQGWREKHVREAVQNSVDAGATKVRIDFRMLDEAMAELPSGSTDFAFVEVSYADDGVGMDEDILLNKFLVLGGSGKKNAPGSVGGFGKAKELLLLPWVRWSIESRSIRVEGHGIQYDVQQIPMRKGTVLSCIMRADDCTNEAAAIGFIKKCYLPGTRFHVNGVEHKANLKAGDLVKSLAGKADVFYEKRSRLSEPAMLVRINGLYMHERGISETIKGTIIVELTGKSTELLTANRDGIREWALSRALDEFQNELAADTSTALRKKRNIISKKYEGERFKSERERQQAASYAEAKVLTFLGDVDKKKLSDQQVQQVQDVLDEIGESAPEDTSDNDAPIDMRAPHGAVQAMMDIPFRGATHVVQATKLMAWQPAFYVRNETEEFHVPSKFMPERMSPGIRKLAKFWGELCRFVLIQLGYDGYYGVGWMFDTDTGACHLRDGGEHWLLLNPFKGGHLGGPLYGLTDPADINWLYACAVHEATHMSDGISHHDESFSSAFTTNVARTANRGVQINKIRQAVVARGPKGAAKPKRAAAADEDAPALPESMREMDGPAPSEASLRAWLDYVAKETGLDIPIGDDVGEFDLSWRRDGMKRGAQVSAEAAFGTAITWRDEINLAAGRADERKVRIVDYETRGEGKDAVAQVGIANGPFTIDTSRPHLEWTAKTKQWRITAAGAAKRLDPSKVPSDVSALLSQWGIMGDQQYLLEMMRGAADGDWNEAYAALATVFNSVDTLVRAFVAYENETVVEGPLSPYSDPSLRDFVQRHQPCSIIVSPIAYRSDVASARDIRGLVFDGRRWSVALSASRWLLERGA